jgi:hypothetical protein
MPRFSLKDLLIGTALLAAGITAICGIAHVPPDLWVIPMWFGGSTLTAAGLSTPFQRTWTGAAIGFAFALAVPLLLSLTALCH